MQSVNNLIKLPIQYLTGDEFLSMVLKYGKPKENILVEYDQMGREFSHVIETPLQELIENEKIFAYKKEIYVIVNNKIFHLDTKLKINQKLITESMYNLGFFFGLKLIEKNKK